MDTIRLALALPALLVTAACSRGSTADSADLQQRLNVAEARADAAEKRARNAELVAQQHQAGPAMMPGEPQQQVGPPELAQTDGNANGGFGQPMNDTNPIEPQPAMQADGAPPSQ